jgi:hypothetical protein
MPVGKLIFRVHALQRMFERGISEREVRAVLESGRVIEDYPHDFPYPSRLLLGFVNARPLLWRQFVTSDH